jgi:hypothetical protein
MRGRVMQSANARLAGKMLVLLLVLQGAPRVSAQQTAMESAADQLAGPIAHSKQSALAIFDFSGPGKEVTLLGRKLADDFSAAITKSAGKLQVVDRSRVEAKRREDHYSPEIVLDSPSSLMFAQELGAEAVVIGEMSLGQSNTLNIELKAYRVDNGKPIHGLRISFPLSEDMRELMAKNVTNDDLPADLSKYPKPGTAGISFPACIYCPKAEYASEALRKHVEGLVELVAIVEVDGRVTNIAVLKGLPGGLTVQAIEAVKEWRLEPATGPDGKPVAVQQIIELGFQLFR